MLGEWLAGLVGRKGADARRDAACCALESLEPRILLSAVLPSEEPDALRVEIDPVVSSAPLAAIEIGVNATDEVPGAPFEGLRLDLVSNVFEEVQGDLGDPGLADIVDGQSAESGFAVDQWPDFLTSDEDRPTDPVDDAVNRYAQARPANATNRRIIIWAKGTGAFRGL